MREVGDEAENWQGRMETTEKIEGSSFPEPLQRRSE
jgi:hypothetical protein